MNWYWYIAFGIVGLIVLVIFLERFKIIKINAPGINDFDWNRTEARMKYYTKTKLFQRLKDEKSQDPIAKNPNEWLKSISKTDYPGIDTPLPPGYKIKKSVNKEDFKHTGTITYTFELFNADGEEVGYIRFSDYPEGKSTYIDYGRIYPGFQGKGLYPYLRREVINHVDKKKYLLETQPVNDNKMSVERLIDHYASFSDPDKIDIDEMFWLEEYSDEPPDLNDFYIRRKPND